MNRATALRRAYWTAQSLTGARLRLMRRLTPTSLVALNLHRVAPSTTRAIDPALFAELVAYLASNFQIRTFLEATTTARVTTRPTVVLSFDDGYQDFVEHAMPILRRHSIRANLNVVPSCVDSGRPPWTTLLGDWIEHAPPDSLRTLRVVGFNHQLLGTRDDDRLAYSTALSGFLKSRSRAERGPLFDKLEDQFEPLQLPTTPMMSLAMVREAAAEGHELGCHSFEHESMGFERLDYFASDLERSAAWFAEHLRSRIEVYAFPNGSYRNEHLAVLEERRINVALLVGERVSSIDASVHPRITMGGSHRGELRLRALGGRAAV